MAKKENNIKVESYTINKEYKIDDAVIFKYKIVYPQFSSEDKKYCLTKINKFYEKIACAEEKYYETKGVSEAMCAYAESKKNNSVFFAYEAIFEYTLTYNERDRISLYFDEYEYSDGAHGNTTRYAGTWDALTGKTVSLKEVFCCIKDYNLYIMQSIFKQAESTQSDIYFEDYKKLIYVNYNENNFYLTHKSVVIFYQQYEIAPYSTGIVTFDIHYKC